MENNIIGNYNDVKTRCMKKIYIPNVALVKEDERNRVSLFGRYNFESIIEVLGKIYFDELMKNGGEYKQILLNTLKEYDCFIAEDIGDVERVQRLVPQLFTAYVMSGINDIRDALGKDKASNILVGSLTPMEAYSELSSVIPDEIKSVFAKWQGTSSAKDMFIDNYKDVSNKYFKDNPVLLKRFSEEQDKSFENLKGAKRLNKTQIDFCVQMLSRYAINCSDNPVEKLFEISPEIARDSFEQHERNITQMKIFFFLFCIVLELCLILETSW